MVGQARHWRIDCYRKQIEGEDPARTGRDPNEAVRSYTKTIRGRKQTLKTAIWTGRLGEGLISRQSITEQPKMKLSYCFARGAALLGRSLPQRHSLRLDHRYWRRSGRDDDHRLTAALAENGPPPEDLFRWRDPVLKQVLQQGNEIFAV